MPVGDKRLTVLYGRIDDSGAVLLPVTLMASDGLEIEIEAAINLAFRGCLAVGNDLVNRLGWRRLGSRPVRFGSDVRLIDHYIATVSLGAEPSNVVVLGGISSQAIVGQRLLSGGRLEVDFKSGSVALR